MVDEYSEIKRIRWMKEKNRNTTGINRYEERGKRETGRRQ